LTRRLPLLAAVVAIPLAIVPGLFLRLFTTPKIVVLYLAAAVLLVSLDAWWPGLKLLARTRYGAVLCGGLLAEVASLLVSAALSNQPLLAFAGTTATRLGAVTGIVTIVIAAALAGYVFLNRSFARRILFAMEMAAAIAAAYGIAQYFGWDPLLRTEIYTEHIPETLIRPPSTLGHAIYFGAFLLPGTLIAASALETGMRRWLHACVFGWCTLAIVLTGARSALLGLAVGGLILAYSQVKFTRGKRTLRYLATASALVALAIGLLAVSTSGQSFRVRVSQWMRDPAGGTRLLVWRDSLHLVRDHPLTGIGPATFTGEFRRIQSLELSHKYPDHYHEDPHNLLLGVAVDQGVPGLAAVLLLTGCGIVCGLGRMRQGSSLSRTLIAALASFTIALQFTPLTGPNWLYFLALIALLVSISKDPVRSDRPECSRKPKLILAACNAAVILAVATSFALQDAAVASTGRWAANRDLDHARESYALSATLMLPSDDLWCSKEIAAMARVLASPQREAALALAKDASIRAEQNSELGFVALVQSAALCMLGSEDRIAEEKLGLAARAAPGWYRPHLRLATLLAAEGRSEDARHEHELALALAGEQRPVITTVLNQR